jgi:hypothetical protein
MNINGENYSLTYDEQAHCIHISGSLRLNGLSAYAPISDSLQQCLNSSNTITIDLSQLEFLNSSGIAMLSKFVIEARNKEALSLHILGSVEIPWQSKSLKNLQRLYPQLELTIS